MCGVVCRLCDRLHNPWHNPYMVQSSTLCPVCARRGVDEDGGAHGPSESCQVYKLIVLLPCTMQSSLARLGGRGCPVLLYGSQRSLVDTRRGTWRAASMASTPRRASRCLAALTRVEVLRSKWNS